MRKTTFTEHDTFNQKTYLRRKVQLHLIRQASALMLKASLHTIAIYASL